MTASATKLTVLYGALLNNTLGIGFIGLNHCNVTYRKCHHYHVANSLESKLDASVVEKLQSSSETTQSIVLLKARDNFSFKVQPIFFQRLVFVSPRLNVKKYRSCILIVETKRLEAISLFHNRYNLRKRGKFKSNQRLFLLALYFFTDSALRMPQAA